MRTLAALLLLSASAVAAPMVDDAGRYHAAPPDRYEGQGIAGAVNAEWLVANAGWRYATDAEIAAQALIAQEAAQAAEALAQLPAVFPTGIAVLDAEGHHIELIPDIESAVVVPVQVSNSPLTPEQREAMKAAAKAQRDANKAAKDALKAEIKAAKNDKAKMEAILKWIEAQ